MQENGGHVRPVALSHIAIVAALIALQAAALFALGKPTICPCGYISLWYGNPAGPETSQQLTDWYSVTHVTHGLVFYLGLGLLMPRWSVGARLVAAMALEVGWEVLENTPMIIERYRRGGLAQGYFGDSIVNSVVDTLATALGFVMAWRFPVKVTVALALAIEVLLGYAIRDNLTLNVVQLIAPSETLTRWQSRR
jgi:hypothetical protein